MTMFRKVFSSHQNGKGDGDPAPMPTFPARPDENADTPNHERIKTQAILARRLPDPEPFASPAPKAEPAPMAETPVMVAPQIEEPAIDPDDLAARAAQAHTQMMQQSERPGAPAVVAPIDPAAAPQPDPEPAAAIPVKSRRRAGRARTRLLGFDPGGDTLADPIAKAKGEVRDETTPRAADAQPAQGFPTGWIVVAKGPGRGQAFAIYTGVSMVGRGEDQAIRLDFGDTAISRQNHAALAYDAEDQKFYIGHGGKSNIIRLNDRPVLSTEELSDGDCIRIGETYLRFVALCGPDFQWGDLTDE